MKKTLNEKFLDELTKCKEPEIFLGVARVLKVDLLTDGIDEEGHHIPKDFYDVLADVITAFAAQDRHRKKELVKIFQQANKQTFKEG